MSSSQRIRDVRLSLNYKQKDFAERLGIKQGSYSYLESGKNSISDRIRIILSQTFNVNLHWLETGEGYMFLNLKEQKGRLQFILNEQNHTPRDAAYITKLSELRIKDVLEGKSTLSNEEISKITAGYKDYSTNWLYSGEGFLYDKRSIEANNSLIQTGGHNSTNSANNFQSNSNDQYIHEIALLKQENQSLKDKIVLLEKMIAMYEK